MTDQTTAAPAAGDVQPVADANPIDSIIDGAETETVKDAPEAEPAEPNEPAEEPWPKKAENALAKAKGKAAQLRAERDQERAARQQLEQKLAQYSQPNTQSNNQQGGELSPAKTGIPTKLDMNKFNNWAEYSEARAEEIADYKIDKKLAERDGKQQVERQTEQEQQWEAQRSTVVHKQAEEFAKEHPDVNSLFEEHADTIRDYPKEIKHALLAADNAPLAFYNLAKEGKLEELGQMSLVDAKVEIRLAQQNAPSKPRTKAPTPLPASRGSVASGKSLDAMSGDELMKWIET